MATASSGLPFGSYKERRADGYSRADSDNMMLSGDWVGPDPTRRIPLVGRAWGRSHSDGGGSANHCAIRETLLEKEHVRRLHSKLLADTTRVWSGSLAGTAPH